MSKTSGRWEAESPFTDLQIFLAPELFFNSGAGSLALSNGVVGVSLASSNAAVLSSNIISFTRTGQYSNPLDQQQFGTAAGTYGPTAVANTGDISGLLPGYPPMLASQMATLGNIQRGPIAKGFRLTSFDIVYSVTGLALAAATCSLSAVTFVKGSAPIVTSLVASGANGLTTAISTGVNVINVPVPTPVYLTTADTAVVLTVSLTAGATGTAFFYGGVLHSDYNFS